MVLKKSASPVKVNMYYKHTVGELKEIAIIGLSLAACLEYVPRILKFFGFVMVCDSLFRNQ
jgi:hypothetical protein